MGGGTITSDIGLDPTALALPEHKIAECCARPDTPIDSSRQKEPALASRVSVKLRGVRYHCRCRQIVNVGLSADAGAKEREGAGQMKMLGVSSMKFKTVCAIALVLAATLVPRQVHAQKKVAGAVLVASGAALMLGAFNYDNSCPSRVFDAYV